MSIIDFAENISLPPGWDSKYDFKTGRRYYVNYFSNYVSWEDPRNRYRISQIGDPLSIQTYSSSPVKSSSPIPFYHINQDVNFSSGRPSPIIGRSYSPLMGSGAIHYHAYKSNEFPTVETSVLKIKSLFPTVSETHIKTLLHKYHYREALVVSALQVEKHPFATPGPYSSPLAVAKHFAAHFIPSAPSSPSKLISSTLKSLSPKSIRSSPKMKLRYLKNVFPVVEESVLLDTLGKSENNVHRASETLQTMGFGKRDIYSARSSLKKRSDDADYFKPKIMNNDPNVIFISLHDDLEPKQKTLDEKQAVKDRLKEKFQEFNEQIIELAMEAAEYNEERAEQILSQSIKDSEKFSKINHETVCARQNLNDEVQQNVAVADSHSVLSNQIDVIITDATDSPQPIVENQISISIEKAEAVNQKTNRTNRSSNFIVTASRFINTFLRDSKTNVDGQVNDRVIPKGRNKSNVGERSVPIGPKPENRKGADPNQRKGPNLEHRKGSRGLAKGSIFSTFSKIRALSSQI